MKRSGPDRRAQILTKATRLFSRHGYEKVTVKQIATACSITEPALYRYFPSKEALWEAVLDSLGRRLNAEALFARLSDEKDVHKILMGLAAHILEFFSDHDDLCRLLLYGGLEGKTRGQKVFKIVRVSFVDFLTEQLDRLKRQRLVRNISSEITARCFVGMVFECALGCTLWKDVSGTVYEPPDILANNVPIFAKGLKRGK